MPYMVAISHCMRVGGCLCTLRRKSCMWSGKLVIAGEARRSLDVGSQKAKKTKQNLFCFVFFMFMTFIFHLSDPSSPE